LSTAFSETIAPQPPRQVTNALEIVSYMKRIQQNNLQLHIRFPRYARNFNSFILGVDEEHKLLAIEELFPRDGESLINSAEPFRIQTMCDGARIRWDCVDRLTRGLHQGYPCYWTDIPAEITYQQRRNTFRANLKDYRPYLTAYLREASGDTFQGHLMDISASGCQMHIQGNLMPTLKSGAYYEPFSVQLPFGELSCKVELRHIHYHEPSDRSVLGMCFLNLSGGTQRQLERFVLQLQRDLRIQQQNGQ
jgi:c-di-GMP-binding flagellar brake protein YcgR